MPEPMSVGDWLAAMPVDEIDARLAEIEAEARMLRAVRKALVPETGGGRDYPGSYRKDIVAVLRDNDREMGPREIKDRLGIDASDNSIHTTLSRMAAAGQVKRTQTGKYRAPDSSA
jgi:hypothetical protein